MPMPWISNGYPFQSTLKTGFHTVPVCLEGCLRSKIVLGLHAVPAYPGMPMPWISSQFTLNRTLSQSTRHAIAMNIQWLCIVPVHFTLSHSALKGEDGPGSQSTQGCMDLQIAPVQCLRSKIVPGFQLSQSTQRCQCHEDPMGMHCPSPFHTVPCCVSLP